MRVLLLGGTGDALALARRLGPGHVYSLAGLGRVPADLACEVRVGGYGGAQGLAAFVVAEGIGLLIDATHPYAARMSRNVCEASASTGVPCWAIRRPAWTPQPGDDWRTADGWNEIVARIAPYRRVLWTLGREPLAHLDEISPSQHWTIRCLDAHAGNARATVIGARGPFSIEGERALFEEREIDIVVSKNSGGGATEAKLAVARELRVPVVMLNRPELPPATREFDDTASALDALAHWPSDQPLLQASR